ncbi:glycosyltransferase family 4 protein [Anaeromyxobacter diazotrophicus]|uniref:Glycosyl transferase n=1 Tax=Anaeromyxobacter diazotrophicus TaxID=2590199 RepID=A0A7I9VIT5_9BACT|nr:glycosyltransferase family 4 protein [Anaeromyxobacter diazotrophicus]GEJ56326.1 glycosyl transferase [Anaeromyxobacter diazotrophicus]
MRILELLSSPVWTGPAEPMASVAAGLRRRGHEVELAVDARRPGDLRERLRALGFTVRDDLALSTRGFPPPLLADALRLSRVGRGFDVVHAHFSHDHAAALLGLRRRPDGPRVVRTVHSARSLRERPLQGLAHRRTDGLVAVCEAHARRLVERFRVDPRRVLATRGAVDAARFTPEGPDLRAELGLAPGQPVAGIVSRVKPDRRHAELVDAFREVADRLPEARLVVVGRGEGLEELRVRVAHRGLERAVVFAGYRTGPELAAAYRTLDAKVLLAEGNDGTCRALLEAMACGRPGVAYRFGAPAEAIVDGATGLLVEDGDVAALASALVELLQAPARARSLGRAARQRIQELFTEEARTGAVERFLVELRQLPPAVL